MAEIEPIIPTGELFVGIEKQPPCILVGGSIFGAILFLAAMIARNNSDKVILVSHYLRQFIP